MRIMFAFILPLLLIASGWAHAATRGDPIIPATAPSLARMYLENEPATQSILAGRQVEVDGYVHSITMNSGRIQIDLRTGLPSPARFLMNAASTKKVLALERGDQVTVICLHMRRKGGAPFGRQCRFRRSIRDPFRPATEPAVLALRFHNSPDTLCEHTVHCTQIQFEYLVYRLRLRWPTMPPSIQKECANEHTLPTSDRCVIHATFTWLAAQPGGHKLTIAQIVQKAPWLPGAPRS